MSFKKGEGKWANIGILSLAAIIFFRIGKRSVTTTNPGVIGTLTATASSTLAGVTKYFAPPSTQGQVVVRKSVGLYTNKG